MAKIHPHLPNATEMPKLFVEYVGMGDSDKPRDYAYSTAERTDLVEAIWRDLRVQSTTLVAFDFSSLVVLEHVRRRLERSERGEPAGDPEIRGVFIFNGGLFTDGHSHPWYTTPMLRRLGRGMEPWIGRSFAMFKMLAGVMWSKGYRVTDGEVRELYPLHERNIDRRDFTRTAKRAKVPHIRLYDLRLCHASHLAAANVPVPVVQRQMRHRSSRTTLRYYVHPLRDARQAVAALETRLLGRVDSNAGSSP